MTNANNNQRVITTTEEAEAFSDAIGGITLDTDVFDQIVANAVATTKKEILDLIKDNSKYLKLEVDLPQVRSEVKAAKTVSELLDVAEDLKNASIEIDELVKSNFLAAHKLNIRQSNHNHTGSWGLKNDAINLCSELSSWRDLVADEVIEAIEKQENCVFEGEAFDELGEVITDVWLKA